MKARRKINRAQLKNTLGWLFAIIAWSALIFETITGKLDGIDGIWLIVFVLFVLAMFLLMGTKETFIAIAVIFVGVSLWLYVEYLQEVINETEIDRSQTLLGRVSIIIIAFGVVAFFRWYFIQPIKEFFRSLWEMISLPGVSKALVHLVFSYMSITTTFGIVYATIYAFLGRSTFHSSGPLYLSDFIYYSVFIPTTLGYPDISPAHWLAKLLTMVEFLFGITVIVIYLGAIVGSISEHFSRKNAG